MSKVILVTGATGKQGGAVIDALLSLKDANFTILAVTRDPSSPSAERLVAKSHRIHLVLGNLDDVPAIFREAQRMSEQPIWGVFSVQVSMGSGITMEGEVAQGRALIDHAIQSGVTHFVYSSVERGGDDASWDNPTPIPHFQSKYYIEKHLHDITTPGMPGEEMRWTIIRPVAFMDNLTPGFSSQVFAAALHNWMGDKPNQWVATSDIGIFVTKALVDSEHWDRKAVGLAGDEVTFSELSGAFRRVTGQPIPEAHWIFGTILTCAVRELRLMLSWFASEGYKANLRARREDHPGMLTVEEWLRQSNFVTKSG